MNKNLKFFLIALVIAIPLFWGINALEGELRNFFFWHEMTENPQITAAQANQLAFEERIRSLKPIRSKRVEDLKIGAKSAMSFYISRQGEERILFEKYGDWRLPIASLTKLMTANVVLEHYDLSKEIRISKEAVNQEENLGKLEVGELLSVEYLLYPLLMESSNDAAFSLANDYDGMAQEDFVGLMNQEAQRLNLQDTHFINPSGLDPEEEEGSEKINYSTINYSNATDLITLVKELLNKPLIWEILSTPKLNLYGPELINSNKLLGEFSGIIGGKTGYTEKALGCFILLSEAPKSKGYLVNVILGTGDRFGEMEKLLEWLRTAYIW